MKHRPQVLMVTHRFVYPPDRGDRIRTWHIVNELARHCDVSLACLSDEPIHVRQWEAVYQTVSRLAIEPAPKGGEAFGLARSLRSGRSITEEAFYSPALHQTIRNWAADTHFDAAIAVCSSTARYIEDLPIRRRVVDLVDVDSCKWADYARYARGLKRRVYRREAMKLARYEDQLAAKYELFVTCEREAAVLTDRLPGADVYVARNGVEQPDSTSMAGLTEPTAVFTGMLNYKPNVDGLTWFVKQVWPAVMSQIEGARFDIVGRGAGRAVRALASTPGVRLVGAVPEIQPYLEASRVAVAPLHIARGIQNKALQAMAAARPVIATAQVRDGLTINGRCPCIVPDSTERWVQTMVALFKHPTLASAFGLRSRLFIVQHFDWSKTLAPLIDNLRSHTVSQPTHAATFTPIRAAA